MLSFRVAPAELETRLCRPMLDGAVEIERVATEAEAATHLPPTGAALQPFARELDAAWSQVVHLIDAARADMVQLAEATAAAAQRYRRADDEANETARRLLMEVV